MLRFQACRKGLRLLRSVGRLLVGAFTNWLAFAATLAVGFFLTPYLVHKLGDSRYGIWAFVESILAYFTLFDLGIAACVVRFVARYHATGDRDELNRLVSTALAMFLGLGAIVFALGIAILPALLSTLSGNDVLWFGLLMLGNLAITLPLSLFPSILDGLERFALKSAIRILMLAVRTAGTLIVLERQPSLWNLGLLYTACNLIEHALLAATAFVCLPGLRLRWRAGQPRESQDGEGLQPARVPGDGRGADVRAVRRGDRRGVSGSGPGDLLRDRPAPRRVRQGTLRTATNTLTPAVSALEAAGDIDAIRRMFLRGTRWVLLSHPAGSNRADRLRPAVSDALARRPGLRRTLLPRTGDPVIHTHTGDRPVGRVPHPLWNRASLRTFARAAFSKRSRTLFSHSCSVRTSASSA